MGNSEISSDNWLTPCPTRCYDIDSVKSLSKNSSRTEQRNIDSLEEDSLPLFVGKNADTGPVSNNHKLEVIIIVIDSKNKTNQQIANI
ncbi:hypothetical protein NHX12_025613 [Muraenolepis orangiensis]|uniref:Uncharacterized protein n=1 Tax=Muraenolepis orangiensis TaxID=630683 RepID=A0A9Q0IR70_9TELE|nr:hypothetical protein NHX12_025613 [Muraenolepis orangiensis]